MEELTEFRKCTQIITDSTFNEMEELAELAEIEN